MILKSCRSNLKPSSASSPTRTRKTEKEEDNEMLNHDEEADDVEFSFDSSPECMYSSFITFQSLSSCRMP